MFLMLLAYPMSHRGYIDCLFSLASSFREIRCIAGTKHCLIQFIFMSEYAIICNLHIQISFRCILRTHVILQYLFWLYNFTKPKEHRNRIIHFYLKSKKQYAYRNLLLLKESKYS